jgi:hypothetical protein
MNVYTELEKQTRKIAAIEELLRSIKGAPQIQGYSGKRFDLNENLNVRELLGRIGELEDSASLSEEDNLITLIDKTSTTDVVYIGEADQGTETDSSTGWRVTKVDSSADPVEVLKSENYSDFGDSWADRTTMSYD